MPGPGVMLFGTIPSLALFENDLPPFFSNFMLFTIYVVFLSKLIKIVH